MFLRKVEKIHRALLFPGQGAQYAGMSRMLPLSEPALAEWYTTAEKISGLPLAKLGREGPPEVLDEDLASQLAVCAYGIAALKSRAAAEVEVAAIVPHSMGIYAALVAAGALAGEDGLRLAKRAGELSLAVVKGREFRMAVILGLLVEEVKTLCAEVSRGETLAVGVACFNSVKQCVISGAAPLVAAVLERAAEAGAISAVSLSIRIPYHTPWMRGVSEEFARALDDVSFKPCRTPIIEPGHGTRLESPAAIRAYLGRFLHEPQNWYPTLVTLIGEGFTRFLDVGPGLTLGRMLQWIDRQVEVRGLFPDERVERLRRYGS